MVLVLDGSSIVCVIFWFGAEVGACFCSRGLGGHRQLSDGDRAQCCDGEDLAAALARNFQKVYLILFQC